MPVYAPPTPSPAAAPRVAQPPPATVGLRAARPGLLQRCGGKICPPGTCNHDDDDRVQRSSIGRGERAGDAPSTVHRALQSAGRPLGDTTRRTMEAHFGHDFANIRIHDDSIAAQSARSVDARAYTVGRDIVFDASLYAPDTRAGRHLLAHELAHVVQQSRGGSGLRPKSAQLRLSPPDDEFERQADQAANELTAGSLASAIHSAPSPSLLQRAPCPSPPTRLGDVPLDPASDCTEPLASVSGQRFLSAKTAT